jgi:hypothetical protein
MKPVVCNPADYCACNHTPLYTADQLRQAKVEVLREAADALPDGWYEVKTYLRRMANELERSKT